MSSGPKQHPIYSLVVPIARTLLATIVALSFFTTVASLGTASFAGPATIACCIGKPGHESGSCNSGLLEPVSKPEPVPEVLHNRNLAPPTARSRKAVGVEAKAEESGHCDLHTSSAGDVPSNAAKKSETEAPSAKSEKSELPIIHTGLPAIHALSSPCSAECVACSVSYTRRPRTREQSSPSSVPRPPLLLTRSVLPSDYAQIRPQNTKWVQLPPRAPPARVS